MNSHRLVILATVMCASRGARYVVVSTLEIKAAVLVSGWMGYELVALGSKTHISSPPKHVVEDGGLKSSGPPSVHGFQDAVFRQTVLPRVATVFCRGRNIYVWSVSPNQSDMLLMTETSSPGVLTQGLSAFRLFPFQNYFISWPDFSLQIRNDDCVAVKLCHSMCAGFRSLADQLKDNQEPKTPPSNTNKCAGTKAQARECVSKTVLKNGWKWDFYGISLLCTGYLCQLYLIIFEGSPPTSDYWTDLSFRKTARARVKESFLHSMLMMNIQNLEIILNKQYSIHSQSPEHHIIAKYQLQ